MSRGGDRGHRGPAKGVGVLPQAPAPPFHPAPLLRAAGGSQSHGVGHGVGRSVGVGLRGWGHHPEESKGSKREQGLPILSESLGTRCGGMAWPGGGTACESWGHRNATPATRTCRDRQGQGRQPPHPGGVTAAVGGQQGTVTCGDRTALLPWGRPAWAQGQAGPGHLLSTRGSGGTEQHPGQGTTVPPALVSCPAPAGDTPKGTGTAPRPRPSPSEGSPKQQRGPCKQQLGQSSTAGNCSLKCRCSPNCNF